MISGVAAVFGLLIEGLFIAACTRRVPSGYPSESAGKR
jgi:hypothetical protein